MTKKGVRVIIRENAVGYGVYSGVFHLDGEKIESLYFSAKTKDECEEWVRQHPPYYIE